jgi:hypothetical protein
VIHIFFGSGSFGSTIESVLRNYSDHSTPIDSKILDDGSMHSYRKEHHVKNVDALNKFLQMDIAGSGAITNSTITTPIYPYMEFKFPTILDQFSSIKSWNTDVKILIFQPDLQAFELNLLFKYYKICCGHMNLGLSGSGIISENQPGIVNWNKDYTHWSQMKLWELREWISIFYPGHAQEFINSQYHIDDSWLKIANTDILYNTKESMLKIIDHCGLTNTKDLTEFVTEWQQAQQYIVDEFDLLDQIVDCSINNQPLVWKPVNIIAEAIIQQRLRARGYEIRCDGLDIFPTDAIMFNTLLEKVNQ